MGRTFEDAVIAIMIGLLCCGGGLLVFIYLSEVLGVITGVVGVLVMFFGDVGWFKPRRKED